MMNKYQTEFEELAVAIAAQAIEDYKTLEKMGIIQKGQCAAEKNWPKKKKKKIKFTTDYVYPTQVKRLIHWIADPNGMRHLLDLTNSDVDCDLILRKLNPWKYY